MEHTSAWRKPVNRSSNAIFTVNRAAKRYRDTAAAQYHNKCHRPVGKGRECPGRGRPTPAHAPQAPDAATKQALQALVDRYNAVLKPKKTLALSALLAKYPEPEKARAALAAAIRKADGGGVKAVVRDEASAATTISPSPNGSQSTGAAAAAEGPTTRRPAAGNGRKYGFPAHLA